jgi:hypothetical protein
MTQTIKTFKTAIITFAAALCLTAAAAASEVNINGMNGLLGSVKDNGTALSAKGKTLGSIGADGTVKDASGKTLGSVDEKGFVRNADSRIAGRVELDNGLVSDHSNNLVGMLDSEGNIRNISGKEVGSYSAGSLKTAAAYLFFFDEMTLLPCSAVAAPKVFVYDKTGSAKGFIEADGTINDRLSMKKGTLDIDGSVRDAFDNAVGSIGADGTVKSASGQVVETFSPQDPNFMAKAVYTLLFETTGSASASL